MKKIVSWMFMIECMLTILMFTTIHAAKGPITQREIFRVEQDLLGAIDRQNSRAAHDFLRELTQQLIREDLDSLQTAERIEAYKSAIDKLHKLGAGLNSKIKNALGDEIIQNIQATKEALKLKLSKITQSLKREWNMVEQDLLGAIDRQNLREAQYFLRELTDQLENIDSLQQAERIEAYKSAIYKLNMLRIGLSQGYPKLKNAVGDQVIQDIKTAKEALESKLSQIEEK